jgi:hypothetical protein
MGKKERMEKADKLRGSNTEMFAMRDAILVPDGWREMSDADQASYLEGAGLSSVLVQAASPSAGIRTLEDAKEWLEESDFVGAVLAARRRPWGQERNGVLSRFPQTTFLIK